MTAKKTTTKAGSKKLKLKRETLKDLDAKKKSKDVKGGQRPDTRFECGDSKNYCPTDLCSRICF